MGKIIAPGNFKTMATWTDAFTMMLEAAAEARNNREIIGAVNEAAKEAKFAARDLPTENNKALDANQRSIAKQMEFDLHRHKQVMARWNACKRKLIATGWDLSADIGFEQQPDGRFKVWQADERGGEIFAQEDGHALMAFLKFVHDTSTKVDPVEYTKQMLAAQGITEQNFDQYKDQLAITNPWKPIV